MKRTHLFPIMSGACDGMSCRSCPRPWRYFVTGMELWGRGDNATFLHGATEDYRRKPTEKLTRARWQRVARRWAGIAVPSFLLLMSAVARAVRAMLDDPPGWAEMPYGTILITYFVLAAVAGAAWLAYLFAAWYPQRKVRRAYIYPAGRELAKITGRRFRRREALGMIQLPADFGEAPVEGQTEASPPRVYVPDVVLDPGMKARIAERVGARLGMPDSKPVWTEAGVECAYCDLRPNPLPPSTVTLEELMEELLSLPITRPMVGVTYGAVRVTMDFDNDSPHTLGSAASGAGKSTFYKFVAMQRMRHGAFAIFLDFKKWSHLRWAGRLASDRVIIEDEVARIHETLLRVLDELVWRKSFNLADEAKLAKLRTIDVYVEEINTLMDLLVEYWGMEVARRKQEARSAVRKAKEKIAEAKQNEDELGVLDGKAELEEAEALLMAAMGLPKVSPAVQALRFGVNLGREFRIHFHFIGQSIDARAAGGRNTRASFRTRMLARWDEKDWKMLAPGIPFIACPSGAVGIWAHVHGSEVEIVRVPYVSDADAVAYVLGGDVPALPAFHGDARPSVDASPRPAVAAVLPLSEIVERLPAKADGSRMTIKALRLASGRQGFPEPVAGTVAPGKAALYPVDDVAAWFRDRERLAAIES